MLAVLFRLIGNIILIIPNIVLLIVRIPYKLLVNNRAGLWIVLGKQKTTLEVDGKVKIR